MSKLPLQNKFLDLSDYGRPIARLIANALKETSVTPIHVTIAFIISGLLGIYFITVGNFVLAAIFLILKSILDAADGELARIKNTPSYVGRYLDSIADIVLNFIILLTIWHITSGSLILSFLAFLGIQLQGTLYNYYYVILRNRWNGDTTSRIIEKGIPKAFDGENQKTVNIYFGLYTFLYGLFDRLIYQLDSTAPDATNFPNWFMSWLSTFGLGFQLLIISILLVLKLEVIIVPFFVGYTLMIPVFILIRKSLS